MYEMIESITESRKLARTMIDPVNAKAKNLAIAKMALAIAANFMGVLFGEVPGTESTIDFFPKNLNQVFRSSSKLV